MCKNDNQLLDKLDFNFPRTSPFRVKKNGVHLIKRISFFKMYFIIKWNSGYICMNVYLN